MRHPVTARIAAGAAALLVLTACQVSRYEVAYDDFVEARQMDAVDRGWVPEWLPESTTDIEEVHDPRTGARVLTATLSEAEVFASHCRTPASTPPEPPFAVPDELDLSDPRDCGDDGVGVLEGSRLVIWRGPVEGFRAEDDDTK